MRSKDRYRPFGDGRYRYACEVRTIALSMGYSIYGCLEVNGSVGMSIYGCLLEYLLEYRFSTLCDDPPQALLQ